MKAWIGLGGNHEASAETVFHAIERIGRLPGSTVLRQSSLYRSAPWGVSGQPDFINAVVELETTLPPEALLESLLEIETALGRIREGERWGPRCIDLDLLTYEDVMLNSVRLVLPHPRMHLRAFVLVPLLELEPGFKIPGLGAAAEHWARLDAEEKGSVTSINPSRQEPSK